MNLWRYLNMFILIGISLVGVSVAGFATGSKFVTEAGQVPSASSSWVYLGVGILMLINGVVSVRMMNTSTPPEKKEEPEQE
jgi:flagellar basal body-associated protein FliL